MINLPLFPMRATFTSGQYLQKYVLGFFISRNVGSHSKQDVIERQKKLLKKGLPPKRRLSNVQNVIVVASGKGGVGKSTTATNLAIALSNIGDFGSVGLLDMDVFGPSIPRMMNISEKPEVDEDQNFVPLTNFGVKCMSMGFLMDENEAAMWRGPMVMSAVQRLLLRTAWGKLNFLVLDLPPGTGDTQLSISQLIHVDGALIVSTPQDIALLDARRGAEMFRKVNIPVLGLVQNMSVFRCPKCGHQEHVFGQDGVTKLASEIGVDVLADIPLDLRIRKASDDGQPIGVEGYSSQQADVYKKLAFAIKQRMEKK